MFPLKKRVYTSYEDLSQAAAEYVFARVKAGLEAKNHFVLGLATGDTPEGTYKELLRLFSQVQIDLSHFYTFNLDEYYPVKQSDQRSFYAYMRNKFWEPLQKINSSYDYKRQSFSLNGETNNPVEEARAYEQKIKEAGGIDLQILGLGINGHIAYNEPGSSKDSSTRLVTLTPSTGERVNTVFKHDLIPHQGLTMGIKTILDAHEIVLLVSGANKQEIFSHLLSLKTPTTDMPASFLLDHPNVIIFADQEAHGL